MHDEGGRALESVDYPEESHTSHTSLVFGEETRTTLIIEFITLLPL